MGKISRIVRHSLVALLLILLPALAATAQTLSKSEPSTAAERAYMSAEKKRFDEQSAYFLLQRSRAETLSMAMTDSPVGQAGWIAEKFYYWTDKTRRPFEQIYTMDRLLTEAMLYLVTDSFATSLRSYTAFRALESEKPDLPLGLKITVPVAFAVAPYDGLAPAPPRSLMERSRINLVQWTKFPRGGHFLMLEEPQLFVEDVRRFGRLLRAKKSF